MVIFGQNSYICDMRLYTLTSDLHGELSRNAHNEQFIKDIEAALGQEFDYRESDFSDFGAIGDIIYVRTGGTEGIFKKVYEGHEGARVRLLTSGQSNSLAASMEIVSWLNQQGLGGEIIHGSVQEIASELLKYYPPVGHKVSPLIHPFVEPGILEGKRFGVVGQPSDWLIGSWVDYDKARDLLGVELIDIPISRLLELAAAGDCGDRRTVAARDHVNGRGPAARLGGMSAEREVRRLTVPGGGPYGSEISEEDFLGSDAIYLGLKQIIAENKLDGLTLRCFDLLTALHNTGCLSLARLNAEGYIATCEGDIPAMLSMAIVRKRFGVSGFQANLSRIDGDKYLFAHCTVPLDMVSDYCYDTHFESGIGVALHGILPTGPARIFKLGSDLEHCIDEPLEIIDNPYGPNLCRTQVLVKGDASLRRYLLRNPLGNHHIIVPVK